MCDTFLERVDTKVGTLIEGVKADMAFLAELDIASLHVLVLLEGISHIVVGLTNSEATGRSMVRLAKALLRQAKQEHSGE